MNCVHYSFSTDGTVSCPFRVQVIDRIGAAPRHYLFATDCLGGSRGHKKPANVQHV